MNTNIFRRDDGSFQPNPIVPISFFKDVRDTGLDGFHAGINHEMPWIEFLRVLKICSSIDYENKEAAPLFAPTVYDGKRDEKHAGQSGMLVIDSDGILTIRPVMDLLSRDGIEAVVYTSARHRMDDKGDRFRIVVPLSNPVDLNTQRRAVRACADYLKERLAPHHDGPVVDTSKQNPVSIFYVPGIYATAGENLFEHIEGDVLSADEWLDAFPQPDFGDRQSSPAEIFTLNRDADWNPYDTECWHRYMSLSSDRYVGLYGLMSSLAMSAINHLYDLSDTELASLADEAQRANPPSEQQNRRSYKALLTEAGKALREASNRVTDPIGVKFLNRKLWGQDEPWKQGFMGVATLASMLADLKAHPVQEIVDAAPVEGSEPVRKKQRFFSRSECRYIPPPVWAVKNLIPENADVGIYGESGTLKSFVALDLTQSLVTSLKAFGTIDTKGCKNAVYFAGEGFHNIVKKRCTAWEVHRSLPPYSVENFYLVNGTPPANDPKAVEADIAEMKQLLGSEPLGVCVIDTLARSLNGGDEDKSYTATQYFSMLKRIKDELGGGITITVGHFGKDVERRERGSSNFRASYDTIIWIELHRKDEASGVHTIQLYVSKQKDADDGLRLWLQSRKVELPDEYNSELSTSLVLVPISEVEGRAALLTESKKKQVAKKQDFANEVHDALVALTPGGGTVTMHRLSKYLADKNKEPNTDEDSYQKLLESYRGKLRRGLQTGNLKQFVRGNGGWAQPVSVMQEQAKETVEMIRDIMSRSSKDEV